MTSYTVVPLHFDFFPKIIPVVLRNVLYAEKTKPNIDWLLDEYESFLERVACLQGDIPKPFFIAVFKEDLKDIQICRGEIESWLMEHEAWTQENVSRGAFWY